MTTKKRYLVRKGTVLDRLTGLEWQRTPTGPMPWVEVVAYVAKLRLGGHSDWRLPTIEELITLIDFSKHNPASGFPGMPSTWFWSSSSSYSGSVSFAWSVHFYYGDVFSLAKTASHYARCVRGGNKE